MFPLMDPAGVVGAAYLASDGWVDPSQLCHALATLARRQGVQVATHTRVRRHRHRARSGHRRTHRPR